METPPHATARAQFTSLVSAWFRRQTEELDESTGSMVRGNGRGKIPDGAWGPAWIEVTWPSVIIEIGWWEGPKKLQDDIEFWLRGNTRVAITLNITASGRIILDAWRKNETGVIESFQRLKAIPGHSPVVNFTIPFEAFYLREKDETETDLIITHEVFTIFAEKVRRKMRSYQRSKAAATRASLKPHPTSD
ncbi:hypothetical protein N7454_009763 [Penicillium verhagenii]|nr:hypothetical protein N7454_009763 [Penicillium verhagenii]